MASNEENQSVEPEGPKPTENEGDDQDIVAMAAALGDLPSFSSSQQYDSASSSIPEPGVTIPVEFHVPSEGLQSAEQPSLTTQERYDPPLEADRKYRIHFGSRPGSYPTERLTYKECEQRHKKLVALLSQFQVEMEGSEIKQFQFRILLGNAVSATKEWDVEPYASIIFDSCARVKVEGVAAIIGKIFRQAAIGIFDEGNDYSNQRLGAIAGNFYSVHQFFAISGSDKLPISNGNALAIMRAIRNEYSHLSGQFGQSNKTIELHNFDSSNNAATVESLLQIVNNVPVGRGRSYQIKEGKAKSKLLEEKEYEDTIATAGFWWLARVIEAAHQSHQLFPDQPSEENGNQTP